LALGFFGLGTGYLIYGPPELIGWPVGLLFCGLFAIYFADLFASVGVKFGERLLGLFHLLTGGWLMYLAFATVVDFAINYSWRV
jgi:hypothetical protein